MTQVPTGIKPELVNAPSPVLRYFLAYPRPVVFGMAVLLCINVAVLSWAKAHLSLGLARVVITTQEDSIYEPPDHLPYEISAFAQLGAPGRADSAQLHDLTQSIADWTQDTLAQVVAVRNWLRSQVQQVAVVNRLAGETPTTLLRELRAGTPFSCGPLATLFQAILQAHGIKARAVQLLRSPPLDRWSTHVTDEVYINGQWILQDPTFNVSWTLSGKPASAWIMHVYHRHSNRLGGQLIPQYGTFTPMPSLTNYYTAPMSLFENVVYLTPDRRSHNLLWRYTPLRVTRTDLRNLVDSPTDAQGSPFIIQNFIVWTGFVWLPIAVILLFCSGLVAAHLRLRTITRGHPSP